VPHLSRVVHYGLLLAGTTVVTVALSARLYRYLEAPGIRVGPTLVHRFDARRNTGRHEAKGYSRGMSWGYGQVREHTLADVLLPDGMNLNPGTGQAWLVLVEGFTPCAVLILC